MAVNVKNQNTQTQANQTTPKPVNQVTPLPVFGLTTKLATYGSGGELFEKLYNKIINSVKYLNEEGGGEEKFTAIKLIKSTYGLNYSAIIVAETSNGFTAAHILMIERTGDYPERLIENVAGVRYEIVRTPADALDDKYVTQAQFAVAEALKVPLNTVTIVDGTLVPNEFDVDNDAAVAALLNNTFNATHSEVAIRVNDYNGFSIPNLISNYKNGKFFINLYFNSDSSDFLDQAGLPVRQDVCISLSYKLNQNQNNKSVNLGNDTIEIVKTYGYIDFEWTGPAIVNNIISTQKFIPNFIVTHIDSPVAPTPDIVMLAVASVLSINEDMNWMQAFRPSPARKGEIDYNDIGALNVEGNIENSPNGFGKKYDTKSKSFTIVELSKFVQTLVRPNIMVSIDVPKAGADTWYSSVLQYIKFRNSREAMARVNEYIMTLTNGAFVNNNTAMFADISNKIHGGFYKVKDGYKDVRHLSSYLSIANFISDTNQSPALISQYTNTLYNSAIPSELRAAERKKYIDEMSNNTAVYKQYYDRLTFNAQFLINLVSALKLAGFAPVFSNMGINNDMFVKRSSADFTSAMLGGDARIMGQNNAYSAFFNPYYYNRTF